MPSEPTTRELSEKVERLEGEIHDNTAQQDGAAPPQQPVSQSSQQQQPARVMPKRSVGYRVRRYIKRNPGRILLGMIIIAAIAVGGYFLWIYLSSYESTDDAQVDGHLNMMSPRIAGTVVGVYVENNDLVKAGQVIVDLDPRDYQAALEQATGAYQQAVAALNAENPSVPIIVTTNATTISVGSSDVAVAEKAVAAAEKELEARQANVRGAEAQNVKAQKDVERYRPLVEKAEISQQQFDAVVATAKSEAASVDAARAAVEVGERDLDQRRTQLTEAQTRLQEARQNAPRQTAAREATVATRKASVTTAQAALDQARLNLSYAKITTPVSGVVANKTVEVGQRLQPGQDMLDVSQIDDIWITANFKETQLRRIRPKQSVDVSVDALGQTFHGYVESMPGATGAVTSLLPPENATGNYVKVVQRLPVRIRLKPGEDPQHRLRIGMSVEPKVWLNSSAQ